MTVIGVDVGLTGAIAVLSGDKAEVHDIPIETIRGPGSKVRRRVHERALAARLGEITAPLFKGEAVAFVEAAQATPQMGVSSAFHFGETFGLLKGALQQLGIDTRVVTPLKWKRAMGLAKEGSREIGRDELREKASSLDLARRLYPMLADELRLKKHDGRAEALLIAHYGAEELGL
jgi:crossover junction endodeoxyribonuclease RuvC